MENIKKLVVKDKYESYLVVVEEYEEVIKFEINSRLVPLDRHFEEIKMHMARLFPEKDYIITIFTRNIKIS